VHFDRDFLSLLVAVIGTSLSAYLYTWQSNEDVEEEIAMGRRRLHDRVGATRGISVVGDDACRRDGHGKPGPAAAAAFDSYLLKPVSKESVTAVLSHLSPDDEK
jgi:hypothetical protein